MRPRQFVTHPCKEFGFKLLGVYMSADLRWETHVGYIISKCVSRLYFLKQLNKASLPSSHLLQFDTTVIRSILEYASPLWHTNLSKPEAEHLEAIQHRAINIIFIIPRLPLMLLCWQWLVPCLQARRLDHRKRFFFRSICQPDSCLCHLLPSPRDPAVTSRLRKLTVYPRPYGLLNCQ